MSVGRDHMSDLHRPPRSEKIRVKARYALELVDGGESYADVATRFGVSASRIREYVVWARVEENPPATVALTLADLPPAPAPARTPTPPRTPPPVEVPAPAPPTVPEDEPYVPPLPRPIPVGDPYDASRYRATLAREVPTGLGIYIFAGGFTVGIKRAGFEVLAQLEEGMYGVETTRANHPGLEVEPNVDAWDLARFRDRVDLVYCNPPCAPFSNAGISAKKVGNMANWWRHDPRVGCITKSFAALGAVRPRVWVWESVQMAFKRGRDLVDELTEAALDLGYSASYVLMNALHLGVPQKRPRFFCVFHDIEIPWEYPDWKNLPTPTVRDALAPIDGIDREETVFAPMPKRDEDLITRLKPGENLRRLWEIENPPETWERNERGQVRGRPRFLDSRLVFDLPAPTFTGGATKFHPTENRYVTMLEQQLICGYPLEYKFIAKNLATKYAQTAQAVMPPVGEWLGRQIHRGLENLIPQQGQVWLRDFAKERHERLR